MRGEYDEKDRAGHRVLDMRHCVDKLLDIRVLADNSKLSDFSDFWGPDYKKKKPYSEDTLEPRRLQEVKDHTL
jgi:hypothetical protein